MKKLFLILPLFFLLNSCTSSSETLCKSAVKAAVRAAEGVATVLQCENLAAVAADLTTPIREMKMCEGVQVGMIGDLICPEIADYVVGFGVNRLPEEWECKGGFAGDQAKDAIKNACLSVITW